MLFHLTSAVVLTKLFIINTPQAADKNQFERRGQGDCCVLLVMLLQVTPKNSLKGMMTDRT